MISKVHRFLQVDRWVLLVTFLLLCIGVVFIYSSSVNYAQVKDLPSLHFFINHLEKMGIGFLFFLATFYILFEFWYKVSRPLGFLSLGVLVLLLVLPQGENINGAKRWIFGIQPSEFAKFGFILFFARKIVEKQQWKEQFQAGVLNLLVVTFFFFFLLFLQPDYSSGLIYWVLALTMMFSGGFRLKYMLLILLAVFMIALIFVWFEPYRIHRFLSFFNDVGSYQSVQSLITLGNGGLFGVGIGESTQKLGYLPMPFTDMLFSIIGEERGFMGVIFYLFLFFVLIWRGLKIAERSTNLYESLIVMGSVVAIMIVGFIHMGVCIGLIPITGQPLPFVSYGGSALVVNMAFVGFILQASYRIHHSKKYA